MTRVFSSTEPAPRWRSPGMHMAASRAWVQLPEHGRRAVLATQQYYSLDNSDHARLIVAVALTDDPVANTAERCPWRRSRGGRDGVCAPLRRRPRPRRGQHQPLRYCMHSETVATRTKRLVAARPDARRATAARLPRDVHELLPYHWGDAADGGPIRAPLMWQVLKDECLKNHGYHRRVDPWNGEVSYVIGCDSGTFLFR